MQEMAEDDYRWSAEHIWKLKLNKSINPCRIRSTKLLCIIQQRRSTTHVVVQELFRVPEVARVVNIAPSTGF